MNKILCFLLCAFLFQANAYSQMSYRTEYYKLTKVYKNGVATEKDGRSGQFITRVKQSCYDSDKNGSTVNNGALTLIDQKGSSSKYLGTCYYGSDCYYSFFDDRGVLNIQTEDGVVYVYKKATPPAGRTTCSLIRSSGGYSGGASGGGYVAPPVNSGTNHSGTSTNRRNKIRCTVCGGTGRKIKENYSGGKFKYCAECGREVNLGHQHVMCDYCKGQGSI